MNKLKATARKIFEEFPLQQDVGTANVFEEDALNQGGLIYKQIAYASANHGAKHLLPILKCLDLNATMIEQEEWDALEKFDPIMFQRLKDAHDEEHASGGSDHGS